MPERLQGRGVALVRVDAIGDFVLWLHAGAALAQHYRQAGQRVTLVANSLWAGFAAELGIFDAVLPVDRKRFQQSLGYRLHIARLLREQHFLLAIQPTYSRDLHGDTLVRLTRAPERVGSVGDASNLRPWEKRLGSRWYTRLVPAAAAPQMELLRNAEFVRHLGVSSYCAGIANLQSFVAASVESELLAELAAVGPFYVLFPGASWHGKQWPIARFRELAERIFYATGWRGIVCGGPADLSVAAALCDGCTLPLLNWAGLTSLAELAAVLGRASLLITNDTAAAHIGPAVGTPTICLLGGGHHGRFLPYQVEQPDGRPLPSVVVHRMPCFGCNWRCIYGAPREAAPCVAEIDLEAAWQAVLAVLASSAKLNLQGSGDSTSSPAGQHLDFVSEHGT